MWACGRALRRGAARLVTARRGMATRAAVQHGADGHWSFAQLPEDAPSVCILGGGVVGLSSAYFLRTMGYHVKVVDRAPQMGLGASYGNACVLCPSYARPKQLVYNWDLLKQILTFKYPFTADIMTMTAGFFGLSKNTDAFEQHTPHWMLNFLPRTELDMQEITRRMVALSKGGPAWICELAAQMQTFVPRDALESGADLDQFQWHYHIAEYGNLQVHCDEAQLNAQRESIAAVFGPLNDDGQKRSQSHGHQLVKWREVSAQEILDMEPAMQMHADKLVGGFVFPDDMSADAYQFTRRMQWVLSETDGVELIPDAEFHHLALDTSAALDDMKELCSEGGLYRPAVKTAHTSQGPVEADYFVVACGSESSMVLPKTLGGHENLRYNPLLRQLPVTGLKGHSFTLFDHSNFSPEQDPELYLYERETGKKVPQEPPIKGCVCNGDNMSFVNTLRFDTRNKRSTGGVPISHLPDAVKAQCDPEFIPSEPNEPPSDSSNVVRMLRCTGFGDLGFRDAGPYATHPRRVDSLLKSVDFLCPQYLTDRVEQAAERFRRLLIHRHWRMFQPRGNSTYHWGGPIGTESPGSDATPAYESQPLFPWSGQRPFSADSAAIVGPCVPYSNVFANTGHGVVGWTCAGTSALLLTEWIESFRMAAAAATASDASPSSEPSDTAAHPPVDVSHVAQGMWRHSTDHAMPNPQEVRFPLASVAAEEWAGPGSTEGLEYRQVSAVLRGLLSPVTGSELASGSSDGAAADTDSGNVVSQGEGSVDVKDQLGVDSWVSSPLPRDHRLMLRLAQVLPFASQAVGHPEHYLPMRFVAGMKDDFARVSRWDSEPLTMDRVAKLRAHANKMAPLPEAEGE